MKKTKLTEEEKYKRLIDEDRKVAPSDEYSESNEVISSANKTLASGQKMKNEVERQEFMKMNPAQKAEFVKGIEERMKKRKGK